MAGVSMSTLVDIEVSLEVEREKKEMNDYKCIKDRLPALLPLSNTTKTNKYYSNIGGYYIFE